jgi:hypothetical protein
MESNIEELFKAALTYLKEEKKDFFLKKNDRFGNRISFLYNNAQEDSLVIELSVLTFTNLKCTPLIAYPEKDIKITLVTMTREYVFYVEQTAIIYVDNYINKLKIFDGDIIEKFKKFILYFANPNISSKNGIGPPRSIVPLKLSDFFC